MIESILSWLPLAAVVVALWLLAVWSMLSGNPTAVNAVVGIPFGAAAAGSIAWVWSRS